jgi:hypothetical protein
MAGSKHRLLLVGTLLAGGVAGAARAADAVGCAEYISTRINDEPAMGHLLGTETQSVTFTVSTNVSPGGVGGGTSVTRTVSYEVGYYEMSDGRLIRVDCRDYTLA